MGKNKVFSDLVGAFFSCVFHLLQSFDMLLPHDGSKFKQTRFLQRGRQWAIQPTSCSNTEQDAGCSYCSAALNFQNEKCICVIILMDLLSKARERIYFRSNTAQPPGYSIKTDGLFAILCFFCFVLIFIAGDVMKKILYTTNLTATTSISRPKLH